MARLLGIERHFTQNRAVHHDIVPVPNFLVPTRCVE